MNDKNKKRKKKDGRKEKIMRKVKNMWEGKKYVGR